MCSNSFFFKNYQINNLNFLFNCILGFMYLNLIKFKFNIQFNLFNKNKKFNNIILLQCSHDTSIYCKSKISEDIYIKQLFQNVSNQDLVVFHPKERNAKFISKILKIKKKYNFNLKVSISNLSFKNYNDLITLSSTSKDKLLSV